VAVGLRPLDCWDCGFESRRGHGCSSFVFVVYFVGSGVCDELIAHSEEFWTVCVCVGMCAFVRVRLILCDIETQKMRRSGPEEGCCATKNLRTFKIQIFMHFLLLWQCFVV
jgi:hypothetical protein